MLAALPSASEAKGRALALPSASERKMKGKAPKEPKCGGLFSSEPSVCTPLPFVEGIVIDEVGRVVDITGISITRSTTRPSQCTASSYTVPEDLTSTFSTIGQWDPNNPDGKGLTITNDALSDATDAALVVGSNSNQVVVRDQTFDATALAGLFSYSDGASIGVYIPTSSSTTFCRSTFVGGHRGVFSKESSLSIVDSTLKGTSDSLVVSGGNVVIAGKTTRILSTSGAGAIKFPVKVVRGSMDIHEGIFGDGTEKASLFAEGNATVNIYGGEWKSQVDSATISDSRQNTINLYHKGYVGNVLVLCDGNAAPTVELLGAGSVASPNYLECPPDYSVPTFPECE